MKVIIVGAGEVGSHLAKKLSADSHDVVIIELKTERCNRAKENLDVMVIQGSGASVKALDTAGIRSADMLIAVSAIDEINIIACMMAKELGVKRKIARIRNPDYSHENAILKPKQLGIDLMINPEYTTAQEIVSHVELSAASDNVDFAKGKLKLVGIRLDPHASIINQTLEQISQDNAHLPFRIAAIYRDEKTIIPTGKEFLRQDDQIFFTVLSNSVKEVLKLCGKNDEPVRKVMILGGTLVGRFVAKLLEKEGNIDVCLIESNKEASEIAANELKHALVIQGDGSDVDLLAAEGIMDMNVFVSVTSDDETNMITALLAKHLGVKRAIAMISRSGYLPLFPSIGLEVSVDKRLVTANAISRFIHHGEVVSVTTLRGVGAEALELVVQAKAKVANRSVNHIKLPHGVILGGIIRGDHVLSLLVIVFFTHMIKLFYLAFRKH